MVACGALIPKPTTAATAVTTNCSTVFSEPMFP